jgi:hypothetical protein
MLDEADKFVMRLLPLKEETPRRGEKRCRREHEYVGDELYDGRCPTCRRASKARWKDRMRAEGRCPTCGGEAWGTITCHYCLSASAFRNIYRVRPW